MNGRTWIGDGDVHQVAEEVVHDREAVRTGALRHLREHRVCDGPYRFQPHFTVAGALRDDKTDTHGKRGPDTSTG
jgi:hypothetical protein